MREKFLLALHLWCVTLCKENRHDLEYQLLGCGYTPELPSEPHHKLFRGKRPTYYANNKLESYTSHIGITRFFGDKIICVEKADIFADVNWIWKSMTKSERKRFYGIEIGSDELEVICHVQV